MAFPLLPLAIGVAGRLGLQQFQQGQAEEQRALAQEQFLEALGEPGTPGQPGRPPIGTAGAAPAIPAVPGTGFLGTEQTDRDRLQFAAQLFGIDDPGIRQLGERLAFDVASGQAGLRESRAAADLANIQNQIAVRTAQFENNALYDRLGLEEEQRQALESERLARERFEFDQQTEAQEQARADLRLQVEQETSDFATVTDPTGTRHVVPRPHTAQYREANQELLTLGNVVDDVGTLIGLMEQSSSLERGLNNETRGRIQRLWGSVVSDIRERENFGQITNDSEAAMLAIDDPTSVLGGSAVLTGTVMGQLREIQRQRVREYNQSGRRARLWALDNWEPNLARGQTRADSMNEFLRTLPNATPAPDSGTVERAARRAAPLSRAQTERLRRDPRLRRNTTIGVRG